MVPDWSSACAWETLPRNSPHGLGHSKRWNLTSNGRFTVKSFYGFISLGGILWETINISLKSICPKKVNLFNCLASNNHIPTLDILAQEGVTDFLLPLLSSVIQPSNLTIICSFIARWPSVFGLFLARLSDSLHHRLPCKSCGVSGVPIFPLLRGMPRRLLLGP